MKQLFFVASSMIVLAWVNCRKDQNFINKNIAVAAISTSHYDHVPLYGNTEEGDETKHKDRKQWPTVKGQLIQHHEEINNKAHLC